MKNTSLLNSLIIVFGALCLSSCEVVGSIFEAGVWVGVIIVVLIIVAVIWLIRKMFK